MSSLKEIYGPVAVITGASSGIGASYAHKLAAQGFHLVLVARRTAQLEQLRDDLSGRYGITAEPVIADLADPVGIAQVVAAAEDLDMGLLVNNAGFRIRRPFADLSRDELDELVQANALGHARLTHRLLPTLLRRKRAGILFTGSIEAAMGFPNSAVYAASKAFIRSLGEGLYGELHHQGIDVLVVEPGSTATENLARQPDGRAEAAISPDQVAKEGLAHLADGPVLAVGNAEERQGVASLAAMPRHEALRMLGQAK